jgi:glycosyltransferase involved in cell wall biosynthesis
VNLERFHPAHKTPEMRQRLLAGRDPDSLLCIYVGRLANEKRVDLLLEAAALPGVALTIIGDGHMREELERRFAGTNTHFTGYLYKHELASAFASADVFVFPGPNETFGQVVQEAMASGLPTVVTEQGSVKDLVREMRTGIVVSHDAAAFARAIQMLRDNRVLLAQLAQGARASAEERPWSSVMAQLEDYYREAIAVAGRFQRIFRTTFYHRPLAIGARLQHWGMISQIPH